jgi:predicted TIM-barrel fold metal-dependent hydrolase
MKAVLLALVLSLATVTSYAQGSGRLPPIIDVHLHAQSSGDLAENGPNPVSGVPPLQSAEEHIQKTLEAMERYNIVLGVVFGDLEDAEQFRESAPDRVLAGCVFGEPSLDVEGLAVRYAAGQLTAMGEVIAQYYGFSPSDAALDQYFTLAESLDVPVCIHTGMSFPGITQYWPRFRVSLGNPLLLEDLLNRHPKLRVWMAHGGFPFLDETIGILNVYPQVYVDISALNWLWPREGFYSYLKDLIDSGFETRIMFGSDQMTWPDAIGPAVEAVEQADFLSEQQKRDILYNNAARFLRLTPEQIAEHHKGSPK